MRGLKPVREKYTGLSQLSHPLRVRGLKLPNSLYSLRANTSHPLRVRGLKHFKVTGIDKSLFGRILYGGVDWNKEWSNIIFIFKVASFTGAWIETQIINEEYIDTFVASFTGAWIETSNEGEVYDDISVASFTGAWIETMKDTDPGMEKLVASFTGAWIETAANIYCLPSMRSHPLRVRGLKQKEWITGIIQAKSHPLRVRGLKH